MDDTPDTFKEFRKRLGHFRKKFASVTDSILRAILLSPEVGYLIVIIVLGTIALIIFPGYIQFLAIITLCLFSMIVLALSTMRDDDK
jgi:hypothetical protein